MVGRREEERKKGSERRKAATDGGRRKGEKSARKIMKESDESRKRWRNEGRTQGLNKRKKEMIKRKGWKDGLMNSMLPLTGYDSFVILLSIVSFILYCLIYTYYHRRLK